MIEYRDGNFGAIKELHEILSDVARIPPELLRAVHIGTAKELQGHKTIEQRLAALEEEKNARERVDRALGGLACILLPSLAEIERFGKEAQCSGT